MKRKLRPYLINDRKPSEWTGSVAILEEFMKSGGHRAVKYAQCWVYAGLVTTICRALGIPCRNVTNYISAHDTNKSMTGLVTDTITFLFWLFTIKLGFEGVLGPPCLVQHTRQVWKQCTLILGYMGHEVSA